MNNKSESFSKAFIIAFVLTLVFIILKLCGVIAWSWWLVVLPILIWAGCSIILKAILYFVFWRHIL